MALLSKAQILEADDATFEEVEVPEWGGSVRVSSMSAADRDSFEASMVPEKGKKTTDKMANFRARFVARCLVNEEGERLFAASDLVALGQKNASVVNRLFDVARRLNGMTQEDVDELEGN